MPFSITIKSWDVQLIASIDRLRSLIADTAVLSPSGKYSAGVLDRDLPLSSRGNPISDHAAVAPCLSPRSCFID
jgi:hypothetical protein